MRLFRSSNAVLAIGFGAAVLAGAYPLDGDQYTGISRLEGYRLAQEGKVAGGWAVDRRCPAQE